MKKIFLTKLAWVTTSLLSALALFLIPTYLSSWLWIREPQGILRPEAEHTLMIWGFTLYMLVSLGFYKLYALCKD